MAKKKKEPDKLAQDAAAALAAGMSYGKWKAMQSVPEKKEEEPLPPGSKICAWCKKPSIHHTYNGYIAATSASKRQ